MKINKFNRFLCLVLALAMSNILTVNLALAETPDYSNFVGAEAQVLTTGPGLDGELTELPDDTDVFQVSFTAGNTYIFTEQYAEGYTLAAPSAFFMYDGVGTPIGTTSGGTSPYATLTYTAIATETLYVLVRKNISIGTYHISYTETEPTFAGGSGSEEDPYQIATCQQLQNISTDLTAFYVLTSDIDCSATSISDTEDPDYNADLYNGGLGFTPLGGPGPGCDIGSSEGTFTGTLDGADYTVDNLTINRGWVSCVAVFARMFGTVENIHFTDASITGMGEYIGTLVGRIGSGGVVRNTSTENVLVTGGSGVGALVGGSWGTVTESFSSGTVNGTNQVGGLVGILVYATLTNSYSTADVSGTSYVGGLLADSAWSNNISNNYATGTVTATESIAGGLVGRIYTASLSMNYNFATGAVSAPAAAGGLIGQFSDSIGAYEDHSSLLINNYFDTFTTGYDVCIGDPLDEMYVSRLDPENYQYGCNAVDTSLVAVPDNYWFDFTKQPLAGWDDDIWFFATDAYPVLSATAEDVVFAGGTGAAEDPYQINSCQQLQNIGSNVTTLAASYILANDIDCSATSITDYTDPNYNGRLYNSGSGFNPIGNVTTPFTGIFDGDGYAVTGLFINRTGIQYVGLFGYVVGGSISNVGLQNVDVTGGPTYVGALVGGSNEGAISNSYSSGTVAGGDRLGGLVGESYGTITNSYSAADASGNGYVGGLVGYSGAPYGVVSDAYSTGNVTGGNDVGGLIGYNSGTVSDTYSTGLVSGAVWLGGLVGVNDGTVTDSFWDTETSGQASSAAGTGKTAAEMKTLATFTSDLGADSWDFTGVWDLDSTKNDGYPLLVAFDYSADPPTIQFTSTSSSAEEAETTVNIEVSLSGVSESPTSVDYAITGGTATVADDYTLAASTATIAAAQTTTNIELIIHEDGTDEDDETIEITISNPANATLGDNTVFTYTITDDDLPVSTSLSPTDGVVTTGETILLAPSEVSGINVRIPTGITLTGAAEWDGSISATATDSYMSLANATIQNTFDADSEVVSLNIDTGLDTAIDLDDEVVVTLPFVGFSLLSSPTVLIYHGDGTTLTVAECTTEFSGDTADTNSLNDSANWSITSGSACYVIGTESLEDNIYIGTRVLSIFTAGEGASVESSSPAASGGGGSKNKTPVTKPINEQVAKPSSPTISTDVQESWAKDFIDELVISGAVEEKTTVSEPNSSFTRAEMIKTALIFFGYQVKPSYNSAFKDVDAKNEYSDYISAAKRAGIINGNPDGTFRPSTNVSRVEALQILFKAAGKSIGKSSIKLAFEDLENNAWYLDLVKYAFEKGIVHGKNPKIFAPNEAITKAELAKVAVKVKKL